jgi:hypothetical protein
MTRRKGSGDRASDMLNIPPVIGQFLRGQNTQVGDMTASEDHRRMPGSNRSSFQ